jgi:hypothetical protein
MARLNGEENPLLLGFLSFELNDFFFSPVANFSMLEIHLTSGL